MCFLMITCTYTRVNCTFYIIKCSEYTNEKTEKSTIVKVNKIAGFINNSKTAQKCLSAVSKNPAVFSTVASCVIAGVIRPVTIAPLPMKDKQDKKYSIASSIAAGLTELVTAPLIFMPFQKCLNKSGDVLLKSGGDLFKNNVKNVKQYKSVTNRCFKMAVLPVISLFRFATISPVVKALYGKKEGEKK